MNELPGTREAAARSLQPHAPDIVWHGRLLIWLRVGFMALTVTVIALNLVALPGLAASQLTPELLRELHRKGISPTLFTAVGMAQSLVTVFTYVAMGVLVFWRRSEDRMALFCAVMLVTFGGIAANPLDDITGGGAMPEPLGGVLALRTLVHLLVVVGQVSFVVFFYLFPSGRFVPRWTRWAALLSMVYWLAVVFLPTPAFLAQGNLLLAFWLIAVIAQVYRYVRVSTPAEREQAKWIVFGFVVAFVIVVAPMVITLLLPSAVANSLYTDVSVASLLLNLRWVVALLLVPIFIAVAILRTHLWDIDVIINRALVYGLLTGLLAAVYAGLTIGMQRLTEAVGGTATESPLAIVVSTLAIAALFQPLRRRIQAVIDRRFYRQKYDAATTISRFTDALRQEVELDQLGAHLVGVVEDTMHPAHVSLWLRSEDQRVQKEQ